MCVFYYDFYTLHGDYFLDNLQPLFLKMSFLSLFYVGVTVMTIVPFITYSCIHAINIQNHTLVLI